MNLEDYNAAFLIRLESREAAINSGFFPERSGKSPQDIEIANPSGSFLNALRRVAHDNTTAHADCRVLWGEFLTPNPPSLGDQREEFLAVLPPSSA
jgi:hypothetical protein